jgi:serine/threonine protein kinase
MYVSRERCTLKGDQGLQTLKVDQLVGSTLGEYRIERLLGHAQLGSAYLARQLSQGRAVMISTFNTPEGVSTSERNQLTARIAQERAILTRLTHPNILPTYDVGEQSGYLYLVTAFVKGASLGQVLKQQTRFTPDQALNVLEQLGAGLDYAHSQGVVHGILSLSNVLISDQLTIKIAGFGLRTVLEVQENTQNTQPPVGLFNAHAPLPGSPEYASPECVLGEPVDARSDIYALGVMLFKLLSGAPPFSGANPRETALQRIQQPVPSVHAVCPDVPEGLDLVISKSLERDPARRYQRAGDVAAAFERVLTLLNATHKGGDSSIQQLAHSPQLTLPPTVNWFDKADNSTGKWQLVPPIVTGYMPAVTPSHSLQKTDRNGTESRQLILPGTATQPDASTEMLPTKAAGNPDSMAGVDPFAWWSATSDRPMAPPTPGTFARRNPGSRRRPAQLGRRRFVTLMVAGTAGLLTVGGISFAHLVQSMKQSQSQIANAPATGPTASTTTQGNTPTVETTRGTQKTPAPSKSPTAKPSPSATNGAQPSPTSQPTQQPTSQPTQPTQPPQPTPTPQPSHTGTVIGQTSMPTNSAVSFTNPADGNGSLLVHTSNGNFAAFERACTHAGVPVNYDSGGGQFLCPAHGAIFSAANGNHVSGTGPSGLGPLPQVTIRVNTDGTITTG